MQMAHKFTSCLITPTPHALLSLSIPANADMSADGELLAYGCGPAVVIAAPNASCALTALRGHTARVNCVRWVPGRAGMAGSAICVLILLYESSYC
jgi:hypothetical protein